MKTKPIYTKLFRLLLALSLFAAGALTDARAAETNNPPAVATASEAKTPTYEETLAWLKKTIDREVCSYVERASSSKSWDSKRTSVVIFEDNQLTVNYYQEGNPREGTEFSSKTKSHCKYTVDISNIDRAELGTGTSDESYDAVLYDVSIICQKNEELISGFNEENNRSYKTKSCLLFVSTNKDLVQRVAKAFNHLLKVAPKDDLFK